MGRIQFDRSAPNTVVITKGIPIPYRRNYIQRALGRDIYRLIPARIEISIDNSGLGKALLILVAKNHVWITQTIYIASLEIFGFDDLDSKNIIGNISLALAHWRSVLLDDRRASVYIDLVLELVKLMGGIFDVVKFHKRLHEWSVQETSDRVILQTSGKN